MKLEGTVRTCLLYETNRIHINGYVFLERLLVSIEYQQCVIHARTLVEAYVQQWTALAYDDDDD